MTRNELTSWLFATCVVILETASDWVRKNANGLQPKIASKIYKGISMAVAIATDRTAGRAITEEWVVVSGYFGGLFLEMWKRTIKVFPGAMLLVTCVLEFPPIMPYESQWRCFQSLDWNHHQSPSNRCEDSPCCGVFCWHGHNSSNKPEIQCIPNRWFDEGDNPWFEKDEKGPEARWLRVPVVISPTRPNAVWGEKI